MKLQRELREFIELLSARGVEFVVIGGHAVAFHGYPRVTADIDFFVRASESYARCIVGALEEFGFSGADPGLFATPQKGRDARTATEPNRPSHEDRRCRLRSSVAESSRGGELDGGKVYLANRDTLLENKRAAGRPKGLADVAEIEKLTKS